MLFEVTRASAIIGGSRVVKQWNKPYTFNSRSVDMAHKHLIRLLGYSSGVLVVKYFKLDTDLRIVD